jgi:hypothetical protein
VSHLVVALVAIELDSHGAKLTGAVADNLPLIEAVYDQPNTSINPSNHRSTHPPIDPPINAVGI